MRRVYVASPLSAPTAAGIARNAARARHLCALAMAAHDDVAAFCSHGFYPMFLDDHDPEQREMGRIAGLVWLDAADEIWVSSKEGITGGMQEEIDLARELQIPVVMDPPCWREEDA